MAKIAKQLTELVGNTPLLELKNFNEKKDLFYEYKWKN